MRTSGMDRAAYFIAGAGIGVFAMFMYGTRSGRRARRNVQRWFEDAAERLSASGQQLYEQGRGLVGQTREAFDRGWKTVTNR